MVRVLTARLLIICVVLFSLAPVVQTQPRYKPRGCSVVDDNLNGTPVAGNLGLPIDYAIVVEGEELSALFRVYPAIFYLKEYGEPNALAAWAIYKDLLRKEGREASCCPDGTVFMGLNLIAYEWRATGGTGLSLPAIEAHEYAHIAQFKYGFPWQGKWRELHADFLAGWYIAHRARFLVTSPNQAMANFYYKGDYEFNSPWHHGTPEERLFAFQAGFEFNRRSNVASGSLAYQAGIDFLAQWRARTR
jgi:hypothetical protein